MSRVDEALTRARGGDPLDPTPPRAQAPQQLPFSAPSEADAPAEAPDRDDVWPPSLPDPAHRSSAAALDRVEPPASDHALLPQLQALEERLTDRFRANRRGEASHPEQIISTVVPETSRPVDGTAERRIDGNVARRFKRLSDWLRRHTEG